MAEKMDMKEVNSKLDMLRMVHGREITYTNGLFHSYDDRHRDAYINPSTGEFDRRGLYNTLVVMDNIVVAKVINNEKIKFVVLTKSNLDCVYKTRGNIYYIDDNLVCDKFKEHCLLISHTGKKTWKFRDTLCINKIKTKGNYYLVSSSEMYQDKLIAYYPQKDLIRNMTEVMITIIII